MADWLSTRIPGPEDDEEGDAGWGFPQTKSGDWINRELDLRSLTNENQQLFWKAIQNGNVNLKTKGEAYSCLSESYFGDFYKMFELAEAGAPPMEMSDWGKPADPCTEKNGPGWAIEIATEFGRSLDMDEFEQTKELLSTDCCYDIGDETLIGPERICGSYEQNMIDGRKKLDELEWGKSHIEELGDSSFYVHFTDYLTHKGQKHTHRCKQLLKVNESYKIYSIKHIHNQEEQNKLDNYYRSVGLK